MKKSLIWVVGALAVLGTSLVQAAPAKAVGAKATVVRTHGKAAHKKHTLTMHHSTHKRAPKKP